MSQGIILKDPADVTNYAMDWSAWLDTNNDGTADSTISTVTWTVPSGLTQGVATNTDTVATVRISGGTAGADYQVTCQITTSGGEVFERSGTIRVVQQ